MRSLLSRAALLVGLVAAASACAERSTDPETGAALYRRHCAPCHGAQGRGDGPVAPTLRTPPTDLTGLAQASGGAFDETAVMMAIDGRRSVAEHGPREMPVWGAVFQAEHVGEPLAIYGPVRDAQALADYLRSIQVGEGASRPAEPSPRGATDPAS